MEIVTLRLNLIRSNGFVQNNLLFNLKYPRINASLIRAVGA